MNYEDYTDSTTGEKYINGHYVGVKHGAPTSDALNVDHTGYEVHKESIRQGTITPDELNKANLPLLISISITKQATKLEYIVGEELDISGLVITGTYDGGVTKNIDITKANVTGFDNSKPTEKQTLTITIDDKKTSYDIKIIDQLLSIAITKPATKTQYNVGEALSIEGLEVTGTYKSGATKKETVTASNVSGFDSSKANDNLTLTITINGKTATYTVKVVAPQPQ